MCIGRGMNFKYGNPLIALLESSHCSIEWLKLLFDAGSSVGVKINKQSVTQALELIDSTNKDKSWKGLINERQ